MHVKTVILNVSEQGDIIVDNYNIALAASMICPHTGRYCIALKFGGAKLWQINLHANFGRVKFGETNTM